jgi:outer membrane protein OmpA-like peptidoglycan-associated protein
MKMASPRAAALALLGGSVFALAACGQAENAAPTTAADTTAPAAPANSTTVSSAAPAPTGQPNLQGNVSGLTGAITAFAVRETATQTIVEMAADTLFAFNSADLSSQAQASLTKVADLIRQGGSGQIEVIGHTDGVGSDSFNTDLSRRRAEAVRNWLTTQNVAPASRFTITAAGKSQPKAANTHPDGSDNPEGRAQNRRVEVIIPK